MVVADERRRDACVYDFSFPGTEADDGSCMVGFLFRSVFVQDAIGYSRLVCERLVKFDDEIVLEVGRHASAVSGRITDNTVVCLVDFHVRTFVECVDYDIRMFVFGEGETEHDGAFGRSHFRYDVVFC